MNALVVGSNKKLILQYIPDRFLLIDDGPLIDELDFPPRRTVTVFDTEEHSFNPLKAMSYLRAVDFVTVLKAVFPEGENTLTKATFEHQVLEALRHKPRSLATLISDTKDTQYAYQKIQRLLMSPVLENVLTRPNNFSFKGTIIARLNRAVIGDFDAFVLGNLLISQFQGAIVVPDFGFYAHPGHASLIRQNRLIAGVTSFDEVGTLKNQLLMVEEKIGSRCTPDDAKTLALYEGLYPDPLREDSEYNKFIARCIA